MFKIHYKHTVNICSNTSINYKNNWIGKLNTLLIMVNKRQHLIQIENVSVKRIFFLVEFRCKTVTSSNLTNSFAFHIRIVSGQNVANVRRLSDESTSSCDVMEKMLRWQHIAPTAPDTVEGFPFDGRDPLILETTPHVMVCGNQAAADWRYVNLEGGLSVLYVV